MNIDELVDNFALFDDLEDRDRYLIDLGRKLPPMAEELKTDKTLLRGCMSKVWMVLGWDKDGRLSIYADGDAHIVRGLIAVLRILYHGKTVEEIQKIDVEQIFKKLGLEKHLSVNRRNGFYTMVERIRLFTAQDN